MPTETIGIIGGTGWLGGAIARALIDTSFIAADSLLLANRSGVHLASPAGVQVLADNQRLIAASTTIVLAVRPEHFNALKVDATGKRVISLMAGVSTQQIANTIGASVVVRAMPNAAVDVRRSFTPWHCSSALSDADIHFVQSLFECVGTAARVPTEDCIDYLSALSGTGPALPALLMMAMTKQAVAAGVPEDIAMLAARGVVVDASQLLDSADPQHMLDALVSYRGVTAAALQSLVSNGFEGMIGQAVNAGAQVARRGM